MERGDRQVELACRWIDDCIFLRRVIWSRACFSILAVLDKPAKALHVTCFEFVRLAELSGCTVNWKFTQVGSVYDLVAHRRAMEQQRRVGTRNVRRQR